MVSNIYSQQIIENLNNSLIQIQVIENENETQEKANHIFVDFLNQLMDAQKHDFIFHARYPDFLMKAWAILSNYELEEKITELFLKHFLQVKSGSHSLIENLNVQLNKAIEKMNYPLISELVKTFNKLQISLDSFIQSQEFDPYEKIYRLYNESNPQHLKILQLLESQNNKPRSPQKLLSIACYRGSYFLAHHLKETNEDFNLVDRQGNNPLHYLKENPENQEDILKIVDLFDENSINLTNNRGNTPLIEALYQGQFSVVKALLDRGANLNFINERNGNSAMHMATWGSNPQFLIPFLKKNQVSLEIVNLDGMTPLASCCQFLLAEQALILVDNGANVHSPVYNKQHKPGRKLIHLLLAKIKRILEDFGTIPWHETEEIINKRCDNLLSIFDLLISKDSKLESINSQDLFRATPLHYACSGPYLDPFTPKPVKEKIYKMMGYIIKKITRKRSEIRPYYTPRRASL